MKYEQPQPGLKWFTIQSLEQCRENVTIDSGSFEPFFLLFFFTSGVTTLKLPDNEVSPAPESLFWLQPQTNFKIENAEKNSGYYLMLHKPLQEAIAYDPALIYHPHFRDLFLTKQLIQVKLSLQLRINSLFNSIYEEETHGHLFKEEILQGYFKILLLTILKQLEENSILEEHDNNLAKKFQQLLEKSFRSKKFVAEYAKALMVGPTYLNTVVKKNTGQSASYHIKQRNVLEAKRKAVYTNMCMKEIAFDLGFTDLPHFSKYFKAATGINFSAFIQKTYSHALAVE